ncbi:LuxR C-terminal-related transcriptional regulator [Kitasatospora sp. McL0602]|uniref:LuxR C-terminal-related transcriptional regulator n=1 Tax=Kitasatospora sp. McL0602 TaxID=3439530 RepID=UPI003F8BCA61
MTTSTAERTHRRQLVRLLTPREAQALDLLVAGHDTPSIARSLGLAPDAARVLLHRALRKLGVRTRAGAAAVLAPPVAVPEAVPVGDLLERLLDSAHDRLVQQTFLLTACRHRAVHCVHLALGAAARRRHEVAALPDPEAWVRAHAFEAALSPWHRGGPRRAHRLHLPHRRIRVRPAPQEEPDRERLTARDRALLKALRRLPRPQRRALVLHDGLGLPATVVAAEVESSTPAAEGRVRAARTALARAVPDLVGPDPLAPGFGDRLSELLHRAAVHGCPRPRRPTPLRLRATGHVRGGLTTAAAALLSLAMGTAVVATLAGNGPSAYFRPTTVATQPCTTPFGPAAPGGQPGIRSFWCSR